MTISQFVRRIAFTAALAITTAMVPAATASALPRIECQDLRNQAAAETFMANWWMSVGQMYLNLGFYQLFLDAYDMAHAHAGFAEAYLAELRMYCR